jgi:predicted CoA-substrate-specific enzyme activase
VIVAGVDIGSLSSKALIMEDGNIRGWKIILTGPDSSESAVSVMNFALKECRLALEDVQYIVGTGYGRVNVPFAQTTITEISCHARGCHWMFPETRTILDMGGQDCKAIRCDEAGRVTNFVMNDKCAAGTGRYLERVAATVNMKLEEIGALSLKGSNPLPISDFCAVFAESDVVKLMHDNQPIPDILAGAHEAIVKRIRSFMQRVGIEESLCISGGVAKNIGVVKRLEAQLSLKAKIAPEPQIIGALGAALFAADHLSRDSQKE